MKKLLIPLIVVLFWYSQSPAQVPEGLNYQAVARDASGNVRSNESIIVRFTLQPGVAAIPTWIETDTAQTDGYGVFTLTIGAGTKTGGIANSFAEIDFSEGDYWIKVEVKEGGNFVIVGSLQKFLSVPYAFMSKTALKSQNDFDTSATNELQILKLSNDTLYLNQGGFVYLGGYDDKIEIQNVKDKSKSDSSYFDIKLNNGQSDRMTSDIVLGQKIISDSSYLRGMINSNSTNLVNETNSRIAGDNDLKSKQFSDSTYLKGLISSEITNRTNSDNTLQTNINNLKIKETSDSLIFAGYLTSTITSLNTETTNRTNADSTLQYNITTESNSRMSVDNSIKSKMSSDSSLLRSIVNTTITNLANEINNRVDADNALKNKVVSDSTYLKGEINNHITADHDTSSANEIQDISVSGTTTPSINLSKNGGSIILLGTGSTTLSRRNDSIIYTTPRIVAGRVGIYGSIISGSGFTVTSTMGSNQYIIDFTTPFTNIISANATLDQTYLQRSTVIRVAYSSNSRIIFYIYTYYSGQPLTGDQDEFSFIVIGQ